MPITPNTQPEVTVDKNGKTTTVHRKSGARPTINTKNGASRVGAQPPTAQQVDDAPESTVVRFADIKVGDIVWKDQEHFGRTDGFVVTAICPAESSGAEGLLVVSGQRQTWIVEPSSETEVLRDEDELAKRLRRLTETEVVKNASDVKVGDIVWDGDEGFVVSETRPSLVDRWGQPAPGFVFLSAKGNYWKVGEKRGVVVLRDEQVWADKIAQREEDY